MPATKKLLREFLWHLPRTPRRLRTVVLNRIMHRAHAPLPGEVIHVDPTMIRGHLTSRLARRIRDRSGVRYGALVDGTWDREVEYFDFAKTVLYESCYARWTEGARWCDTPLYQGYLQQLERGGPCRFGSVEELEDRYRALDALFEEIRRQGRMSTAPEHLVVVNFASDGTLIWGPNGRHRIAIARIAGLPMMPAGVGFVHVDGRAHFQNARRNAPPAV